MVLVIYTGKTNFVILTPHAKIFKVVHIKCKKQNFYKETGENVCNIGLVKEFLNSIQKRKTSIAKTDKVDFMQIKNCALCNTQLTQS